MIGKVVLYAVIIANSVEKCRENIEYDMKQKKNKWMA